jgi:hypothetical protein
MKNVFLYFEDRAEKECIQFEGQGNTKCHGFKYSLSNTGGFPMIFAPYLIQRTAYISLHLRSLGNSIIYNIKNLEY